MDQIQNGVCVDHFPNKGWSDYGVNVKLIDTSFLINPKTIIDLTHIDFSVSIESDVVSIKLTSNNHPSQNQTIYKIQKDKIKQLISDIQSVIT